MDSKQLWERAKIIRRVREFFDRQQYLEVDTPLLSPDLIPEACLEVFQTARLPPEGSRRQQQALWLIPSPEIWMKKLIARHRTSLYQICKCFRNGESSGRFHSPEFTMLEYYTVGADYRGSLALTEELFAQFLPPPFVPFGRVTVEEAFSRWAGFDLYGRAAQGPQAMRAEARRLGLDPPPDLGTAALYDLIFIHTVEPKLPRKTPLVLMDYPAFVPCLAKKSPDGKTMERWELYWRGLELANCYSEETDPEEVRCYFVREGEAKNRESLVPHAVDRDYWKTFLPRQDEAGMEWPFPACSGVALGLDRLIMTLTGHAAIDGVLPFPLGEL